MGRSRFCFRGKSHRAISPQITSRRSADLWPGKRRSARMHSSQRNSWDTEIAGEAQRSQSGTVCDSVDRSEIRPHFRTAPSSAATGSLVASSLASSWWGSSTHWCWWVWRGQHAPCVWHPKVLNLSAWSRTCRAIALWRRLAIRGKFRALFVTIWSRSLLHYCAGHDGT